MKFLCLGFHNEQMWNALSENERQALVEESFAYERELRRSGNYLDSHALHGAQTATTLRFSRNNLLVTDGPFAESKEQLGGVMILEARDREHAVELMSRLPCMRVGGSLEIRPLNEELTAS
jgi:hypothetical protein